VAAIKDGKPPDGGAAVNQRRTLGDMRALGAEQALTIYGEEL
jgi:hypothetical protein